MNTNKEKGALQWPCCGLFLFPQQISYDILQHISNIRIKPERWHKWWHSLSLCSNLRARRQSVRQGHSPHILAHSHTKVCNAGWHGVQTGRHLPCVLPEQACSSPCTSPLESVRAPCMVATNKSTNEMFSQISCWPQYAISCLNRSNSKSDGLWNILSAGAVAVLRSDYCSQFSLKAKPLGASWRLVACWNWHPGRSRLTSQAKPLAPKWVPNVTSISRTSCKYEKDLGTCWLQIHASLSGG